MASGLGLWLVVASFATAVGTAALVAALWKQRSKPGAGWLLAALVAQALWGATYGVALLVASEPLRHALAAVGIALLSGLGAYFVAFALEYTGRAQLRGRPTGVVVAVTPLAILAVAATNHLHGLLWTPRPATVEIAGVWGVAYGFQPVAKVIAGIGVGVVALGSLLLFDTVLSYGPLYRREAVAVGLSPVPPMTALLIWLFEVGPAFELNFAPLLFLVHIPLDAYAFVGSDMFEFHPATRRTGERAAIDDLGNPVVVVDEQGRIVTLNDAAADTLGVRKQAALADPLEHHVGESLDHRDGGEVTVRVDGTPRTFSVTATPLRVDDDRVGSTLVWQDVTEDRRREQRLAVLNRVLRHNLRNDMTVIRGFTSSAANRVEDETVEEMLQTALDKTDQLLSLGQTARDVERTLEGEPTADTVDLPALVSCVADRVAGSADTDVDVAVDAPEVTVETDRETLRTVLGELVENAVAHGTPAESGGGQGEAADSGTVADGGATADTGTGDDPGHDRERAPVRVSVERGAETVRIAVADDGPGVPEGELAVVEGGRETALDHGSGLGLWLARWGADRIGADLSFETGDGTTATLSLPLGDERGSTGAATRASDDA